MIDAYLATSLAKKETDQAKIVKSAWDSDGYAMFTDNEIGDKCLAVPLAVNNKCLDAGSSCNKDKKCEEVFLRYVDALSKGYVKDFEAFKKESKTQGYLNTAFSIAAGIFGDRTASPELNDDEEKKKKRNKNIAIGAGVLLATGIVVTVLILRSKKK